jgi:hypothetical protein
LPPNVDRTQTSHQFGDVPIATKSVSLRNADVLLAPFGPRNIFEFAALLEYGLNLVSTQQARNARDRAGELPRIILPHPLHGICRCEVYVRLLVSKWAHTSGLIEPLLVALQKAADAGPMAL